MFLAAPQIFLMFLRLSPATQAFDDEKKAYIRKKLTTMVYYWFQVVLILGVILFLFLSVLDYLVARPYFDYFLRLRFGESTLLLASYALVKKMQTTNCKPIYLLSMIAITVISAAVTIELMIIRLGGDSSNYYAGLNLLIVGVLAFMPANLVLSLIISFIIYLVWLIPLVFHWNTGNLNSIIAHNFFMTATLFMMLVWRHLHFRYILDTFADSYELKKSHEKLQAQLIYTQKMESVGILAGGFAHNIKNTLTAIMGHTRTILDNNKDDISKTIYKRIYYIEKASVHVSQMTSKILSFAKTNEIKVTLFDVNALVRDTYDMASQLIPSFINVYFELPDKPILASGDANQIEQAFLNLILNARDAITGTGEIHISTRSVVLAEDNSYVARLVHPAIIIPGKYAFIQISDTGKGIDVDILPRIFEPFFTTKSANHGTGLGLALTYNIIKLQHGYIIVDSQPGIGATFTIFLPAAEAVAFAE